MSLLTRPKGWHRHTVVACILLFAGVAQLFVAIALYAGGYNSDLLAVLASHEIVIGGVVFGSRLYAWWLPEIPEVE